jgi:hypothetical protein
MKIRLWRVGPIALVLGAVVIVGTVVGGIAYAATRSDNPGTAVTSDHGSPSPSASDHDANDDNGGVRATTSPHPEESDGPAGACADNDADDAAGHQNGTDNDADDATGHHNGSGNDDATDDHGGDCRSGHDD